MHQLKYVDIFENHVTIIHILRDITLPTCYRIIHGSFRPFRMPLTLMRHISAFCLYIFIKKWYHFSRKYKTGYLIPIKNTRERKYEYHNDLLILSLVVFSAKVSSVW